MTTIHIPWGDGGIDLEVSKEIQFSATLVVGTLGALLLFRTVMSTFYLYVRTVLWWFCISFGVAWLWNSLLDYWQDPEASEAIADRARQVGDWFAYRAI